jgi:hypothetical protein
MGVAITQQKARGCWRRAIRAPNRFQAKWIPARVKKTRQAPDRPAGYQLFVAGAAVQVGLDLQPRAAAKSGPVDLQILHDPLHVIAGLGERD